MPGQAWRMSDPGQNILLVCTGNTCRSPLARALLLSLRPEWEVRSAGLSARAGAPASDGSRRVARELGLSLEEHAARPLTAADVEWADLIVGMTEAHRRSLNRLYPEAERRTRLLREVAGFNPPLDIADPFGQPVEAYRRCAEDMVAALHSWLELEPQEAENVT